MVGNKEENLGGIDMYINDNQLMLAENEVTLNKIEMDVKEKEEICKGIAAAQEKAFLPVDQNEFDDKPEHSEIYADIQNAKISGALIPTQILSLMFMGKAGTKIFAKRVAKGGALGDIALVFDYNDGNISEDVEVAMFDVMTIAMGNYGEHYDGINKDNLTDAKKSIKKVAGRVLRYWTGDLDIGIKDLVRLLYTNLSSLKVDRGMEISVDRVYAAIYGYVEKEHGYPEKHYMKRKSVYALTREDLKRAIEGVGIEVDGAIKLLNRHNLLYLQPSSIGYQCEVKGGGSCYCVRILANYKHEDYTDYNYNPNERI